MSFTVPVASWLGSVDDLAHRLLLFLRERDVPRGKVVGEPVRLRRAWNGNHSLGCNPCERNLAQAASPLVGELLDLVGNRPIFVEGLSLELGGCGPDVRRCQPLLVGFPSLILVRTHSSA